MALADSKFDNLSVADIDSLIDDANYSQKHQKKLLGEYPFWRARLLIWSKLCAYKSHSLLPPRDGWHKVGKMDPSIFCPEMDSRLISWFLACHRLSLDEILRVPFSKPYATFFQSHSVPIESRSFDSFKCIASTKVLGYIQYSIHETEKWRWR